MARPLRVEYPGAYYHVINRGNAGENIFLSDRDREKFLEYLAVATQRFSIIIHTYCLMTNHFHLLVETPEPNLSRAIQWLNVSYATYFNRKRSRKGHLFQGRFKSILVDEDEYLVQLSRYIHLNPVRANMADGPAKYPWSSYPVFAGKQKKPDWLDTSLLTYFGKTKKERFRSYQSFVEDIDPLTLEDPGKRVVAGFILGDVDFVTWVQKNFLDAKEADQEIPQLRSLKPRTDLDALMAGVCETTGCNPEQIKRRGGKRNQVRELAIWLARELTGLSGRELGEFFGGISGAAITMCCKKFNNNLSRDKSLQRIVSKTKKRIFNI